MMWWLGLAALGVALADTWLLIVLPLPLWLTLAWAALSAALGWWLQRGEDLTLWSEIESDLQNGRLPTVEALDAMLAVLGGWALIAPGWLTDLGGGAMMVPLARRALIGPIRALLREWLGRRRNSG